MIDINHENLSVRKQCELLSLNRSSLYYQTVGEKKYNLLLMRLLDEEYTRHPFTGVEKMVVYLKELRHPVNPKHVRRLLRMMGLEAIYPKKKLSISDISHKKYPYLLTGLEINFLAKLPTSLTWVPWFSDSISHSSMYALTGLNHFNLSVCSLQFPLPTLTLTDCITTISPRLSTKCMWSKN
ncbi:MAG: transposase [Proteobacteria bacterium]|nr:transposase [Pseudomonadota bacterium]